LEEYLEGEDSPESGILCVDSVSRKNPYFGQSTEEEYYGDGVVLCVNNVESPLTIYSCILRLQLRYGTCFFSSLVLIGFMPRKMSDCLGSWSWGNQLALHIWGIISLCVMWCIWQERNARSFEDRESGLLELKKLVLHTMFFMESCILIS
jgi:hypothetical protein